MNVPDEKYIIDNQYHIFKFFLDKVNERYDINDSKLKLTACTVVKTEERILQICAFMKDFPHKSISILILMIDDDFIQVLSVNRDVFNNSINDNEYNEFFYDIDTEVADNMFEYVKLYSRQNKIKEIIKIIS